MMKGVNNPLFLLPEDFSRALKENSLATNLVTPTIWSVANQNVSDAAW